MEYLFLLGGIVVTDIEKLVSGGAEEVNPRECND